MNLKLHSTFVHSQHLASTAGNIFEKTDIMKRIIEVFLKFVWGLTHTEKNKKNKKKRK